MSKANKINVLIHEKYNFAINSDYVVDEEGEIYYKLPASFLTKGMLQSIEDRVNADIDKRIGIVSVKIGGTSWSWVKYMGNRWQGENVPKLIDDVTSYLLWRCAGDFVENIKKQNFITLKQFECLLKIYHQTNYNRSKYTYTYERDEDISDEEAMSFGCYY